MRAFAPAGALAIGLSAAPSAQAAGFYLQEQSVRGAGRAYSGEVADSGVRSLWWNPAAIAGADREAYAGLHAVLLESTVEDAGSTIAYPGRPAAAVQGEARALQPISDGVAPNFAASAPLTDRISLGLSVAAPYNFTTEYRPAAFARYDALESRLTTADVQVSIGLRLADALDIGAGVSAQYADAKLSRAFPNLSPALADAVSELKGDGWGRGWTAGAVARLGRATFGASYRSAIEHELEGRVSISGLQGPLVGGNLAGPASASFTTPWIATLGARWQASDRVTLNLQLQRFGWSEFDTIEIERSGVADTLGQNYRDTTTLAVGVDYALSPRIALRAGVQRDPTPTRPVQRSARVPDGDRWLYSVGATARLTEALEMDLALSYIRLEETALHEHGLFYGGTPAAVATTLRGRARGSGVVLSIGAQSRF